MKLTTILGLTAGLMVSSHLFGAEFKVYYLGGQSNMDGYGTVSELPEDWRGTVENVMIFQGNQGVDGAPEGGEGAWAPLQPGFGIGFTSDGSINTLSGRFGPELAFGRRMAELNPGKRIAIIKYSRGGTSLLEGASGYGNWEPDSEQGGGWNQYDFALATIRNATANADIDGDGEADILVPSGIAWMQGEADAYDSPVAARAYRANLHQMMSLLRAALRTDDLPIAIGKIHDSGRDEDGLLMDYSPVVQRAQADYAAADHCTALVDTGEDIEWSDDWHYGSRDYILLGAAFANAIDALSDTCP